MRSLWLQWIGLSLLMLPVGAELPRHWELNSNLPAAFSGGLDRTVYYQGRASGLLRSTAAVGTKDYAVLSQRLRAEPFRGRRLRMSGFVRTQGVSGWAGMWLRVDGLQGPPLAFDNMQNRPILGTTPWKPYQIELEVPPEASELHFGLLLAGSGQAWIDELRFETLGPSYPGSSQRARLRGEGPENLNFELGI